MDDKEIAKEILLKIIEEDILDRSEFPQADTSVDLICEAYRKILKTVKES